MSKTRKTIRIVAFLLIVIAIFVLTQNIFTTKYIYPGTVTGAGEVWGEYQELLKKGVEFDAVFIGSSGYLYDIDPMKIYKDTGIVTFNLASSGQPVPVTHYLAKEVLETQSPKVLVIDAVKMFVDVFFQGGYRYWLDTVPLSRNKLELASKYAKAYAGDDEDKEKSAFTSAIFPFFQYHDNWPRLTAFHFSGGGLGDTYRKGWLSSAETGGTGLTIARADELANQWHTQEGWQVNMVDGTEQLTTDRHVMYDPQLVEEYWQMVLDISRLCAEKGTQMVLMKTPHFGYVYNDEGAWTMLESNIVKERAAWDGIDFLDLQYDVDLGVDWSQDVAAGTQHLDWVGAHKLSGYLGEMLQMKFGLEGRYCPEYEEDMDLYGKAMELLELQVEADLFQYLKKLSGFEDVTVFFSASDDMASGLTDEICQALNDFGLTVDFKKLVYSDAYAAVVENGSVSFEAYSNREIEKRGSLKNGSSYMVGSRGWLIGAKSNIVIDGKEYSRNKRGLNIVVLDNRSGVVLDSLTFDTYNPNAATVAVRTGPSRYNSFYAYDEYLRTEYEGEDFSA